MNRLRSTRTDIATNRCLPLFVSLVLTLLISACGGPAGRQSASGSAAPAAGAPAADSGAQTVTGKAPVAAGSFPSIVVLRPIGGGEFPPQSAPPSMDQEQQTFIPSLLLVRTGQPVDFLNHDD